MILVQVPAGDQRQFASSDKLAAAIRRGELGPDARIYHRATAQWLPITVHPEFRKLATERPSEPLPPLARTRWTFFAVDTPEPPREDATVPVQRADPKQPSAAAPEPTSTGWRNALGRAIGRFRPSGNPSPS